jgi:GNAT superfamily N-acetyltransferase
MHTDLQIDALDPDDDRGARAWFDLLTEAARVDAPELPPPCWAFTRGDLRHPYPTRTTEHWLGRLGEAVVGGYRLELPGAENLTNADAVLVVAPVRRREGLGRALLAHLGDRARRAGRQRVTFEVSTPVEDPRGGAGAGFARAVDAHQALVETGRRLDLASSGRAALEASHARLLRTSEAHSGGYSLLRWSQTPPAGYLDDLAELAYRMEVDPPLGELVVEPKRYDAKRLLLEVEAARLRGLRQYSTGVRRDASGRLVGFTTLTRYTDHPRYAEQWDTVVAPGHRGHRLGLRCKIENLRWARAHEPALDTVDTWNAEENAPMVAINVAMGFQPFQAWAAWQWETGPPAD